jgi:hypothetical protein
VYCKNLWSKAGADGVTLPVAVGLQVFVDFKFMVICLKVECFYRFGGGSSGWDGSVDHFRSLFAASP